jgi:hypothetical protein
MESLTPSPDPISSHAPAGREALPIRLLDDPEPADQDPAAVILTCANCGAAMDERKCKLICRCGYFLSCSDYY